MDSVVRPVSGERDRAAFAALVEEYVGWIRSRYRDDERFVVELLDRQSLGDELATLSTMYGPPRGRAFLAEAADGIRGCGAYRRFDDTTCEMKRVFVPERFQGSGLGRRLCGEVIEKARADGYERMRLDTLDRMREAAALYRSFGFRPCAPYHDYPAGLMPSMVFMELRL